MTSNSDHQSEIEFCMSVLKAESEAIDQIARSLDGDLGSCFTRAVDLLEACTGHVVVTGMGKSGLIGQKMSATLSSLDQPSNFMHPSEAVHGDLGRIRKGDLAIMLSFSGQTEELVNLGAILKANDIPTIGISSNPDSAMARLCTVHISLGSMKEACPLNLAPTTSTTATLAIGDTLALAQAKRRQLKHEDFKKHHPGGLLGAGLKPVSDLMRFKIGINAVIVRHDATLEDAIRSSNPSIQSSVIMLVDESGRLRGTFTDTDLRRHLQEHGPTGMSSSIGQVMTPSGDTLTIDSLVRDAVELFTREGRRQIGVLDADGTPIGIIDVDDLVAMKVVKE